MTVTRIETPGGRIGVSRFVDRGYYSKWRVLADDTAVSVGAGGIFEWHAATTRMRRTTWFLDAFEAASVSLAGDAFFVREGALHAWRRACRTFDRLFAVTTPLSVSADGTHVACERGAQVVVLRCADGQTVATLERPYASGQVSLGHAGRWLLFTNNVSPQSGSGWVEFTVLSTADGKIMMESTAAGDDAVVGLADDGLAVDYEERYGSGSIELDPGAPRAPIFPVPDFPRWSRRAVPFAVAGRALSWCGTQLQALDLATGASVAVFAESVRTNLVALSADGRMLAQLPFHGNASVVAVADGSVQHPFEVPKNVHPSALAVLEDGRVFVASSNHLRCPDGTQIPLPQWGAAQELAVSRDGRVLAIRTGSDWNPCGPVVVLVEGAVHTALPGDTRETAARCLALRADGRLLAVSSWNGIQLWDVAARQLVRCLEAPLAIALAFAADGQLYACHHDTTVCAY